MRTVQAASLQSALAAAASADLEASQKGQPVRKKSVMGSGCIAPPAVAAHVRKTMADKSKRSA